MQQASEFNEALPILYKTTFPDTAIFSWFKLINLKLNVESYYINK